MAVTNRIFANSATSMFGFKMAPNPIAIAALALSATHGKRAAAVDAELLG
jgi:hypothetical protein